MQKKQIDWDKAREHLASFEDVAGKLSEQISTLINQKLNKFNSESKEVVFSLKKTFIIISVFNIVLIITLIFLILLIHINITYLSKIKHLSSFPSLNPNPVISIDGNGHIKMSNPAAKLLAKRLFREANPLNFITPIKNKLMRDSKEDLVLVEEFQETYLRYKIYWFESHHEYHLYLEDVSKQILYEKQLNKLAFYDVSTELPNKSKFLEDIYYYETSNRYERLCLIVADIDQLQNIISIAGHEKVDQVVKILAQSWLQIIRSEQVPI